MKNFKKVLALVLAVVMLLSFATVASAVTSDFYEDVDDIDYTEAVDVLGSIGVLEGYPDDTFRPEKTITRAEAAKIIAMFDNKSSKINGLYASANPFSDCVDHWAESYIAYGAKTGIIAGVGGDKFAPSANVTGVQFLKMVLVVLGYDAKAEGLEGKNWDVNTLALAKRAGLTTTLGVKFDYSADLKRQEAAVIMLDALRADTVVYGNALGANVSKLLSEIEKFNETFDKKDPATYKPAFAGINVNGIIYVTVVGAVKTGDKLMKDWDLAEGVTSDAFYRPYRTWKLDGVTIGKYMFDVEAEYTARTNLCNVFVDLGVAKTDIDTELGIERAVNGNMDYHYKYDSHDASANCGLEGDAIGARGTLTQVFFMGYNGNDVPVYRITEIDTWLGRVTKVTNTTTYRDGHLQSVGNVEVTVVDSDHSEAKNVTYYTTEKFSKDDYVLLTYSFREDGDETLKVAYTGKAGIKSLTLAKAETAALNGFSTTQTKVGADWIYNAKHAYLGVVAFDYPTVTPKEEDNAVYQKTVGENYTFLYDTYGNVIGIVDSDIAMDYMVVDWTYLEHEAGHGVVYADVVDLNAKLTKAVVVSQYENVGDGDDIADILNGAGGKEYGVNNTEFYDKLYYYAIDADGKYIMKAVNGTKYGADAGNDDWGVAILENKAYLYGTNNGEVVDWVKTVINDDTKILVHEMDGTYSATTGKDVGTIFAANAEVVMDASGTYAEVIYLYGNVYRQSSVNTGFVIAPAIPAVIENVDDEKYCKIDVFFAGKPQTVYMDWANYNKIAGNTGFFDFRFTDVADGVIIVEVVKTGDQKDKAVVVKAYAGTTLVLADGTAYKVSPDVVIYDVDLDTAVVTEIETVGYGDEVMLQLNTAEVVVAIYNLYSEP